MHGRKLLVSPLGLFCPRGNLYSRQRSSAEACAKHLKDAIENQ
jgi:hypothetical protein